MEHSTKHGPPCRNATTTITTIRASDTVLLTTFRRDGSPVATPVWFTAEGPNLWMVTTAESGKVKRLRANPRVEVAASTRMGRPRSAAVAGIATVFGDVEPQRRGVALIDRYGWQARYFQWRNRRAGRAMVAICIVPDPE